MTELVINNHNSILTEVSLFFLSYKYYMKPLQLLEKLKSVQSTKSSVQKADQIVQKMKEVTKWAQMTITVTQQVQKKTVNWRRQQSYDFMKEDKVWLNLKNIYMNCSCKKFDAKNVKYIIVKNPYFKTIACTCPRFAGRAGNADKCACNHNNKVHYA